MLATTHDSLYLSLSLSLVCHFIGQDGYNVRVKVPKANKLLTGGALASTDSHPLFPAFILIHRPYLKTVRKRFSTWPGSKHNTATRNDDFEDGSLYYFHIFYSSVNTHSNIHKHTRTHAHNTVGSKRRNTIFKSFPYFLNDFYFIQHFLTPTTKMCWSSHPGFIECAVAFCVRAYACWWMNECDRVLT